MPMKKKEDITKLRKNIWTHFQIGLIFALSFSLWAFNITTERESPLAYNDSNSLEEIIETTPITMHEKPKPIPPPLKLELVIDILPIDEVEFVEKKEPEHTASKLSPISDTKIKRTPPAKFIAKPKKPIPTMPPPIEEETVIEDILIFAENMPVFSSECAASSTVEKERRFCSDKAIMTFISKSLRYPAIARENDIQGTVVLSFIVDKDGKLIDKKILKDIGGGCGAEAMRILDKMNHWIPGKQNARPVKVRFNLPIRFKLRK